MTSWVGRALRRGILSSHYPAVPATSDEVPETARPPVVPPGALAGAGARSSCPVEAIGDGSVDQGRCIRCARCCAEGFAFDGTTEASVRRRTDLVWAHRQTAPMPAVDAPLAPLGRSLHVFLIDVGSCNACNLEVLGIANPYYDATRLGIFFTNSPRHADILLVVGTPTEEMLPALHRAYEALPAPKAVVAVGACPISGGVFRGVPGLPGPLDGFVPVDVFVPGCPPTPIAVLDGLLRLSGRSRAPSGER
jgi:Ni,Fe-hydrogenase III small subunit